MANKTRIEWCDLTINPIVGCTKCSPGCGNCYAEKMAIRLSGHLSATGERYRNVVSFSPHDGRGKWNGMTHIDFSCFYSLPKNPARIFVGSMGDTFHESVSHDSINELFFQMSGWPQHTFMLLTKRPERAGMMISCVPREGSVWPAPNIWLGVTVCNQEEADEKIPTLFSMPAAKRFVSVEPMLSPIDLRHWVFCSEISCDECDRDCRSHGGFYRGLDWVICGGETGIGARPMDPDWARSLRDQCGIARVPFFFKQMTGKAPIPTGLLVREITV